MVTLKMFIINELDIINYKILWGLCMNNRVKIAHEFARGDDGKDSDIDILIVSDYWEEIDSIITDVVGDIVLDQQELISPHIMSVERFNNTKDYSFLTNVLEDGVVLV